MAACSGGTSWDRALADEDVIDRPEISVMRRSVCAVRVRPGWYRLASFRKVDTRIIIMRCRIVWRIRTIALGSMLPNLSCQLGDLFPVAITSSSIEKVEVVPSFVWLSLLNSQLVAIDHCGWKGRLTLSMTPWRLEPANLPDSILPTANFTGRRLRPGQFHHRQKRTNPLIYSVKCAVIYYILRA